MPQTKDESYDKARDLAEEALGEYAKGDRETGAKLAKEAVKANRDAAEDVVHDLDEDAATTGRAGRSAQSP